MSLRRREEHTVVSRMPAHSRSPTAKSLRRIVGNLDISQFRHPPFEHHLTRQGASEMDFITQLAQDSRIVEVVHMPMAEAHRK